MSGWHVPLPPQFKLQAWCGRIIQDWTWDKDQPCCPDCERVLVVHGTKTRIKSESYLLGMQQAEAMKGLHRAVQRWRKVRAADTLERMFSLSDLVEELMKRGKVARLRASGPNLRIVR